MKKRIVYIVIILSVVLYVLNSIEAINDNIAILKKGDDIIADYRPIIYEQREKYKELMQMKTDINKCCNPYIPDDFRYVAGEWNTGFVIEDEEINQFVWIPCTNIKNNLDIPILEKKNFTPNFLISYFQCYENNENYADFIKSSLENGGFYVSRYLIGKSIDNRAISKEQEDKWVNISQKEAEVIAKNMYYKVNSAIMNGYAYDTILSFIDFDSLKHVENPIKNIYDLLDGNLEMTSEYTDEFVIYRENMGMSDNNLDLNLSKNTRYSMNENEISQYIGFRTIIYK